MGKKMRNMLENMRKMTGDDDESSIDNRIKEKMTSIWSPMMKLVMRMNHLIRTQLMEKSQLTKE